MSNAVRQFVIDELSIRKAIPISAERIAVLGNFAPSLGEVASQVLTVDLAGAWAEEARFPWNGVDLACRGAELLVLGRDGQVGSIDDGLITEGWLEQGRPLGPMRGITTLGDVTVAFGMNRNVYVYEGASWRRFETGFVYHGEIDFESLLDSPGALNGVARNGDELVTVGDYGEIWRSPLSHAAWVEEPSGTTLTLEAVCFADGEEFIVGQSGTFLRNRVQQQGVPTLHCKDVCGALVSAAGVLHRFENGVLERLDLRASKLSAGFGLHVASSATSLFFSRDGRSWTSLR